MVEARKGWAYVAGTGANKLVSIDIADPTFPARSAPYLYATSLGPTGFNQPSNVHLAGTTLYVAFYGAVLTHGGPPSGLAIYDVSNPVAPVLGPTLAAPANVNFDHLEISGSVGLIANTYQGGTGGILVLDLGGTDSPTGRIGRLQTDDLEVIRDQRIGGDLTVGGNIIAGQAPGLSGVTTQVDITASFTPGTPQGPSVPKPAMFSLTIALAAGANIDIRSGPNSSSLTSIISPSTGVPVDSGGSYPPWVLWTFTWWQLPGTWFVVNLSAPDPAPSPWYIAWRVMEWY